MVEAFWGDHQFHPLICQESTSEWKNSHLLSRVKHFFLDSAVLSAFDLVWIDA